MKTLPLVTGLLLLAARGAFAQSDQPSNGSPQQSAQEYSVVKRGGNDRLLERVEYEEHNGHQVPRFHRVTELATGMNYLKNGQWVESREEITILPDGTAAAIEAQHQAYFPVNINDGVIELVTPDGKHLKSRPVGLSYWDGQNSVLIAELKSSVGMLVSSNQIIYPDAFTDFKADLRYTYTKAGFEQDIIFREQPQAPATYNLDAQNSTLQMMTEFFDTPEPAQNNSSTDRSSGLQDTALTFGQMKMLQGKAFSTSDSSQAKTSARGISVSKSWEHLNGRTFLFEAVPFSKIEAQLENLPVAGSSAPIAKISSSARHIVSSKRLLPPRRIAKTGTNTVQIAKAKTSHAPGVVLDYVAIDSGPTDFTFKGDTTYFISGYIEFGGTVTFEGGTVIKLNEYGEIDISGCTIVNKTGPYRRAIFTSMNDEVVGETISGSSGSPVSSDVGTFLLTTGGTFRNMRFSHVAFAICNYSDNPIDIWDCQFIDLDEMADLADGDLSLHNVLIKETQGDPAINMEDGTLLAENVTCDGYALGGGGTRFLYNCLLNYGTSVTWYIDPSNHGTLVAANLYRIGGDGYYYLTNTSPYRNVGSTNITPDLLTELRSKTTFPPVVYTAKTFTTATNFFVHAQRDTNTLPDLGYHYDPLDYVFGGVETYSNITFAAGTAVAWYNSSSYGLGLNADDIVVAFNGTVTHPCVYTAVPMVQEGGILSVRFATAGMVGKGVHDDPAYAPQIVENFTLNTGDDGANYFRDLTTPVIVNANNSEFWSSAMGGYSMALNLTNCLIHRCRLEADCDCSPALRLRNCTMIGNALTGQHWSSATWPVWIVNCVFDGTVISIDDFSGGDTNITYCNYNAFLTGSNQFSVQGPNVITNADFNWQSGPLGDFYQASNSLLIDQGNTTADVLGLYHFTTQTSQIKETNSPVDIGYHYVALDDNNEPFDTDGDGIPDYLEDSNGNGIADIGESDWTDYYNGHLPKLQITSGNYQIAHATLEFTNAFVVKVTDTNGIALVNAPVSIEVTNGDMTVRLGSGGDDFDEVDLRTDAGGYVSVVGHGNSEIADTNGITAVIANSGAQTTNVNFYGYLIPRPSVVLTCPTNNGTYLVGPAQTLLLTATAHGFSGTTIDHVDYSYEQFGGGDPPIGTAFDYPFSFTWTNTDWVDAFNQSYFELTAVATDSAGVASDPSTANSFTIALDSDGHGMPDYWQILFFGHTGVDPNADFDGDGLNNLQEYQQGSDPTEYYNGVLPDLKVVSGDNQNGAPDSFLPLPLVIFASSTNNHVLTNAPITFSITSGPGQLAATNGGALESEVDAITDTNGLVSVWIFCSTSALLQNTVRVIASSDGHSVELDAHFTFSDRDGDGVSDSDEIKFGSDPTDSSDMPPSLPPSDPSDHTPPQIFLTEPGNATIVP